MAYRQLRVAKFGRLVGIIKLYDLTQLCSVNKTPAKELFVFKNNLILVCPAHGGPGFRTQNEQSIIMPQAVTAPHKLHTVLPRPFPYVRHAITSCATMKGICRNVPHTFRVGLATIPQVTGGLSIPGIGRTKRIDTHPTPGLP